MRVKLIPKLALALVILLLNFSYSSAQWYTTNSSDEMTGEENYYAHSQSVTATEQMGFPYTNTKAWLGVGCDGQSEWAYVGFSESPNLQDTETKDGYNLVSTRIKWDDRVENVTMTQDWSAKFVHFRYPQSIIPKIGGSNTVLLELNWYGEGSTYFRFSLNGSSDAISKIRRSCSNI